MKEKMMGKGKFANMPSEVVMKEYPKPNYSTDPRLDDTIVRLDDDMRDATKTLNKNRPKTMF